MSLIYRDIQLSRAYSIETLKDVFITTNKGLAYACKNFDKTLGKKENAIAPCMTDIFLGTILWIQNPIRYDAYNEKQILASCYSSIKLDNKSISKFTREVENLKDKQKITNEDYMLMKDYNVVEDMLSDKIMGDSDNIDEKTTYEVIQEIKRSITLEYENRVVEQQNESLKNKLEKDAVEKKYNDLVNNIKLEAKKEAKVKSIVKVIALVFIEIFLVGLELYLNIIDNLNNNSVLIRVISYCLLAIFPIIQSFKYVKNYKRYVVKLYREKCKKMKIES